MKYYCFCYVIAIVSVSRTDANSGSAFFSPSTQYTVGEYAVAQAIVVVVLSVVFIIVLPLNTNTLFKCDLSMICCFRLLIIYLM